MSFSKDDIELKALELKNVVQSIPNLRKAFIQAANGNFESEEIQNVLNASEPLKAATPPEKLRALSQERADIIYDEIEGSLEVAEASLDRVRLVLKDRTAIYADEHKQAAQEDIFDHLGYTNSALVKLTPQLKSEERQRQADKHIARAQGFLPAAQSHAQEDNSDRIAQVEAGTSRIKNIHNIVSGMVAKFATNNPVSVEEEAQLYAYANLLPKDTRHAFGQTSFDLGVDHIKISQSALKRLRNTIAYIYLIDKELIPGGLDVAGDFNDQRQNLIDEGVNTFCEIMPQEKSANRNATFVGFAENYLRQSQYFATD